MVCSEHVKEQIFVRRRKRLHKWWFAFLLCVDRVSDGIRIGALWLAVQCGKERLTPSQQVFEHSRLLSNYRVQFWKVSFSEFAECGELSLVEGIRHGITTCDGVHSKKLETCVPESSHDVIDVQHSSIPLLHLHQSLGTFRTQKMRMTNTSVSSLRMRMTFFPSRTASIMKLTINTSASSWLNRPSSSPTIKILGARVHVQRRRERSILFVLLFIMTSLLGRGEVRVRL